MKKLLNNRQFLLLNFGQFVSLVGTEMQDFALALYVLNVTGSSTKFASVLAITIIPRILLGPLLSVFSDWFDKKKIIVMMDVLSGVVILGFWRIYSTGTISMIHIYFLVIILSLISCLFNPTIGSILPLIVKKEEILEANSINSFINSFGYLIAPLLAAAIMSKVSMGLLLFINGISFLLSALSEMFLKIPKIQKSKDEASNKRFNVSNFKKDFIEGIKCIYNIKILKNIVITVCIINLVFNPTLSVGLPFISKTIIGISDGQYGILNSIMVIGSFIAPVLLTLISKKTDVNKIFIFGLLGCSAITILLGINSSNGFLSMFQENSLLPFVFLCVNGVVMYIFVNMVNICISTIKQREVPVEILGRVNGVFSSIAMSVIPLGQMIYGVLFDKLPIYIPLTITACTLIIMPFIFSRGVNADEKYVEIKEPQ